MTVVPLACSVPRDGVRVYRRQLLPRLPGAPTG